MVRIGNFLFRYRNIVFSLAAVAVLAPSPRIMANDMVALLLGVCVMLCGQGLRILTIGLAYIKRGGSRHRVYAQNLVTQGIFAHCRNPMYVGNLLMVIGFGLALNSMICFIAGGALAAFAYQAIILAEEDYLRREFGADYDRYCADVPRWRINPIGLVATMRSMQFDWKRVTEKEYGTLLNSFAGLPLALCLRHHLFGWGDPGWRALTPICVSWSLLVAILCFTARFFKKARQAQARRARAA